MYTENKKQELNPEFILNNASGVYQVDEKLV
jgi:metal-dependent HD superfamily phosphatase/phosphodiesterase